MWAHFNGAAFEITTPYNGPRLSEGTSLEPRNNKHRGPDLGAAVTFTNDHPPQWLLQGKGGSRAWLWTLTPHWNHGTEIFPGFPKPGDLLLHNGDFPS